MKRLYTIISSENNKAGNLNFWKQKKNVYYTEHDNNIVFF
jgi:hypothetical protein